jgi:hypothetical protein
VVFVFAFAFLGFPCGGVFQVEIKEDLLLFLLFLAPGGCDLATILRILLSALREQICKIKESCVDKFRGFVDEYAASIKARPAGRLRDLVFP